MHVNILIIYVMVAVRLFVASGMEMAYITLVCGRFTQTRSWRELVELYRLADSLDPVHVPSRYNIAPTQDVPVVRRLAHVDERELALLRWGLIPRGRRTWRWAPG